MWQEKDNALQAAFTFADFSQAVAFMTEIAIVAEKQNHHPDWSNVWNKVSFKLNTHDAGGTVTDKDRKLAEAISATAKRYKSEH
ncbi:MAG: pterin-4-alpha-carbinolamine dehydratase [Epsilonproteobacteria bacterium]|nr:MAG: pterin-4-alpha-carbinolamine dehydratase [Campylobacterota bacterium]